MPTNHSGDNLSERCLSIANARGLWREIAVDDLTLNVKGNIDFNHTLTLRRMIYENHDTLTDKILREWLMTLPVNFGLMGVYNDQVFAAADKIGSTPIFYSNISNSLIISDSARLLVKRLGQPICENIDQDAMLAFEMSGYTVGSSTLHKNIKRLKPGQLLITDENDTLLTRYHRYEPWNYSEGCKESFCKTLNDTILAVFECLIENSNGRQLAIPVSAGFDSRLVASTLKCLGAKNVMCFSYGQAGNCDAVIGKAVAERLGYPWHFILTNSKIQRRLFASDEHEEYMQYAESFSAIPFRQDIIPIRELLNQNLIQRDAILVNGNSGDFISGGHIPKLFFESSHVETYDIQTVIDEIIKKHFSLWTFNTQAAPPERLIRVILEELSEEGLTNIEADRLFGVFEFSEFTNRQSKFVIGGQRIYEFFGLDWEMPLWDHRLLDFWQAVPLSYKKNQCLYKSILKQNNWGNVWVDIPVNKKNISPVWLRALRNLFKVGFAPLGRERWHDFERRYLNYHTDTVGNYALYPYTHIISSKKNGRSAVSWHVEHYLNSLNNNH